MSHAQANGLSAIWTNGGSTNPWTWKSGSSTVACSTANSSTQCIASGVYGTQGTAAATNTPGGRKNAIRWTDSNGNLWLFGGLGGDPNSSTTIWFNDLWEYSATAGAWIWMGGSSTVSASGYQNGVYGTQGTAAATNLPGSRQGAAAWVDSSGNLWLFGGDGYDSSSSDEEYLNDLWMYSTTTNQWTWMGGSKTVACTTANDTTQCMSAGVYGALGTAGSSNIPGGRKNAVTWTDKSGNFWLLGGQGGDPSTGASIWFNDLWEYSTSTNEWTWMGGSNSIGTGGYQNGVYGTQGTAASSNLPGSRQGASSWTDATGNLWLFGGYGYDSSSANPGYLNDLWVYTTTSGEWRWVDGSNTFTCTSSNGSTQCGAEGGSASGVVNYPEGRQGAAFWKDNSGNFWIFGGQGGDPNTGFGLSLDDLWAYSPTTGRWMLEGGKSPINGVTYTNGVYGTLGTAAATNLPGSRQQAAAWKDSNGKFWLFGGDGYDSSSSSEEYLNDFWSLSPSAGSSGVSLTANTSTPAYGDTITLTATASTTCTGLCSFWIFDGTTVLTPGALPNSTSSTGTRTLTFTNSTLEAGSHYLSVEYVDSYAGTLVNSYPYYLHVSAQAATPSFSPAGGTYTAAQTVSISSATSGAAIYYTTDGTTPTSKSTLYSTPITVSATETLQAIAVASGYNNSTVASATYTINTASAATPTFSPAGGTYTAAQTVSISDTTSGATIYYTTDGTTPTANSTVYSAPITVSATETLQAIAVASGYNNSTVASATYTISTSNPTPVASSLSPAFTSQGSSAFTLTVNGSGFISTSVVYWGSTTLTTQYVSSTQLTAQVPASDVATSGTAAITVRTPTPGGGTSNSVQFEIDSVSSTAIAPSFPSPAATVQAGGTATFAVGLPTTLTLSGITCLNLPTGSSCSYSASTGAVSITTIATTPAGNYTVTIVFNGTQSKSATGFIFLPWLLLPLFFARKKLAAHRAWFAALGVLLLAGVLCAVGCGGSSSSTASKQVTSSGTVTLTVQ